ncbi:hypothetical protein ROHU_010805 [Labeo rohita]|uniref:Uncharacterized protein n=1 Tax=Labeo rohita TaxID=84645 RepID=A0A498LR23_LABRO|nr:hypothetical protein ROHU_010805 [Labeo rohita]
MTIKDLNKLSNNISKFNLNSKEGHSKEVHHHIRDDKHLFINYPEQASLSWPTVDVNVQRKMKQASGSLADIATVITLLEEYRVAVSSGI